MRRRFYEEPYTPPEIHWSRTTQRMQMRRRLKDDVSIEYKIALCIALFLSTCWDDDWEPWY